MYKLHYIAIHFFLFSVNVFSQNLKVSFDFAYFGDSYTGGNDRREKFQAILRNQNDYFVCVDGYDASPTKKDSNGYMLRYTDLSRMESPALFSYGFKLNSPKGLCILKNTLFIADIDKIVSCDLMGKKKIEYDLSKYSSELYDIAGINDSTLFVSATDSGFIYQVNVNSGEVIKTEFGKIPGITSMSYEYGDSVVYVCSKGDGRTSGQVIKLSLTSKKSKALYKNAGICFGIRKFSKYLVYTTWDKNKDTPNLYTIPIGSSTPSSWESAAWEKSYGTKLHMRQPCIFAVSPRTSRSADLFVPDNKSGIIYFVSMELTK